MTRPTDSVQDLLTSAMTEGKRRIVTLAALFSVLAIVALVAGVFWPKKYSATATLLVEPRSTIGATTATEGPPRWALVNAIMFSKKVLREIVVTGGWVSPADPRAEERLLNQISGRIQISSPAANTTGAALVKITYSDPEAERTLKIANKLTEIYIRESVGTEEHARRAAFEFIDGQANEYARKLSEVHEQVLEYYRTHHPAAPPTRRPGTPAPVAPPRGAKISPEELASLRAEEATLLAEVGRKRVPVGPDLEQAERRYRERAVQLQADLDKLLTMYTGEHPDVKRVRSELAQATANAEQAHAEREAAATAEAAAPEDDAKRAARTRLEIVQKKIASMTAGQNRTAPEEPIAVAPDNRQQDPDMSIIRQDAAMSELLRGYEATRDIYQDMLKRREQARVALELAEQRGLQIQIQEAPELPATPIGARLLYIVFVGILLAATLPLALLIALIKLDGRVRSVGQAQGSTKLPVLVSIPYVPEPDEKKRQRRRFVIAQVLVALVFIVYAAVFYFRAKA